jgi:hypothetical protein
MHTPDFQLFENKMATVSRQPLSEQENTEAHRIYEEGTEENVSV